MNDSFFVAAPHNLNGRSGPYVRCYGGSTRLGRPKNGTAGYFGVMCGKTWFGAYRQTFSSRSKPLRPRLLNGQKMKWYFE